MRWGEKGEGSKIDWRVGVGERGEMGGGGAVGEVTLKQRKRENAKSSGVVRGGVGWSMGGQGARRDFSPNSVFSFTFSPALAGRSSR